jgi:hypothetical protein
VDVATCVSGGSTDLSASVECDPGARVKSPTPPAVAPNLVFADQYRTAAKFQEYIASLGGGSIARSGTRCASPPAPWSIGVVTEGRIYCSLPTDKITYFYRWTYSQSFIVLTVLSTDIKGLTAWWNALPNLALRSS